MLTACSAARDSQPVDDKRQSANAIASASDAKQPVERKETMANTLLFNASFDLSETELVLTYEVENRDQRDVYLLNRLYRPTPTWVMGPDLIYIHLLRDKATIWFNKKLADIPTDRNVLSPVAPYVTPLRAGQRFKEQVHIPLPVNEYREYGPFPEPTGPPRKRMYKQVYFTLGYYWSVSGMKEKVSQIEGQEVVMPIAPPGTRLQFGELTTPTYSINVPVNELRASD
ncbi:MAG: hypothetical protein H7Y30_13735 [Pyrinomonadaceae bacterium]|nr:hypothetical protein [Pyrinomonadaceae bacterium]